MTAFRFPLIGRKTPKPAKFYLNHPCRLENSLAKIPLAMVDTLGFRNIVDIFKNNKTETYRIVLGGSSSKY